MINSIEMPSSYIEPSIVFDEKEGKGGNVSINKYNFKPMVNKVGRPSIWEIKLNEGWQIKQKEWSFDSPIEISFSDSDSDSGKTHLFWTLKYLDK